MSKNRTLMTFGLAMAFLLSSRQSRADEGMWLPLLIKDYNYSEMKRLGCKLTPEQIYSVNTSSLKDAVVQLGGFCTAELVSPEGLLFTNHHCAYDAIQSISSVSNDYLTDGFWAMSRGEERHITGLTVSFLVRMEDVTDKIDAAVKEADEGDEMMARMTAEREITQEASEDDKYRAQVRSMFDGNASYLFVYQTFRDIRLVGAPPSSIGKFGGDTDNWMWPRHTGDFSVLRIYADENNEPADHSESNVPYKSKHFLPISIKGLNEGDYNMVMGFPGNTDRYLTSYEVSQQMRVTNPVFVKLFGKRLEIMKKHMDADDAVRIKLASSYASLSNSHKYFKGQSKSLNRNNLVQTLKTNETRFQNWADKDENRDAFGFILSGMDQLIRNADDVQKLSAYVNIAGFGPGMVTSNIPVYRLHRTMAASPKDPSQWESSIEMVRGSMDSRYEDYDRATDQEILAQMAAAIINDMPTDQLPSFYSSKLYEKSKGNTVEEKCASMAKTIFAKSMLLNDEKLTAFLDKPKLKKLEKDPGVQYLLSIIQWFRSELQTRQSVFNSELGDKRQAYMEGLMKMQPTKKFYPDANFTMRLTYGSVKGYSSFDGTPYNTFTYADQILAKEDPSSDEFIVPTKLKTLIENKDFGRYGVGGNLPVCFINNTDITGGNSGSPVIDGEGNLVGIAFDGNWESMASDLVFEEDYVRTISVDARYVLFIIEKYAGAKHLLDEMEIVSTPVE